jgi:hypothetical protein
MHQSLALAETVGEQMGVLVMVLAIHRSDNADEVGWDQMCALVQQLVE